MKEAPAVRPSSHHTAGGNKWDALKKTTRRVIIKPFQEVSTLHHEYVVLGALYICISATFLNSPPAWLQLLQEAQRQATTTNRFEQGVVFHQNVDLKAKVGESWNMTEQVAVFEMPGAHDRQQHTTSGILPGPILHAEPALQQPIGLEHGKISNLADRFDMFYKQMYYLCMQ